MLQACDVWSCQAGLGLSTHTGALAGGLYERTSGAAGPLGSYQRRAPEWAVLHELVARNAQPMLAELRDAGPDGGGLARYVERELAARLRCGVLAHGFTRVRCQTCHDEIVVAFSCKRRGLCPSCTTTTAGVASRGGPMRTPAPLLGPADAAHASGSV